MSTATQEVIEIAEARNLDLRTAAYVLAITRLNDYYNTRGIDVWFDRLFYILPYPNQINSTYLSFAVRYHLTDVFDWESLTSSLLILKLSSNLESLIITHGLQ